MTDNSGEYRSQAVRETLASPGARHTLIRAGRPQTNGAVGALHKTMLEDCWRPAFARYLHVRFTGLRRDLGQWLRYYDFDRVRTPAVSPAVGSLPRSSTVPAR